MQSFRSETHVDELVLRAQAATRMASADAPQLWSQVLAVAPDHPQALFQAGQATLRRKDYARARAFLQRASAAAPGNPQVALTLSFACRDMGDTAAEMAALTRALTIDPYFYPALIAKGAALERAGNTRQAAKTYKDALVLVPADAELPAGLRNAVDRAREVVREDLAALEKLVADRLQNAGARPSGEALERFNECRDVALGKKKIYTQQPSMLHVPRLPAIQFYDDALFPWLAELEKAAPAIRDEYLALAAREPGGLVPYVDHPDGKPINQWKELNRSRRWSVFFLWENGRRLDDRCAHAPQTVAALSKVPMLEIPRFGPTVLFSVLAPHTTIPAHSSVTNARLVVHLPLIVPDGCRFRVGNETRPWREGKAWVFDDTIDHEAWNDSDDYRVILMIDIWNPFLSTAERELISELLNGIRDHYSGEAA